MTLQRIIFSIALTLAFSGGAIAEFSFRLPDLNNRPQAVRDLLQEAYAELSSHEASAEHWGKLGLMLNINDYPDAAMTALKQASNLEPNNPEWLTAIGLIHERSSDLEQAIANLSRAAELAPLHGELLFYLARLHEELGDYDQALELYNRTRKLVSQKDRGIVDFAIGSVQLNRGSYEESKQYLLRAGQELPDSTKVRGALLKLSSFLPIDSQHIPDASSAVNKGDVELPLPYEEEIALKYNRKKDFLHFYFYKLFREQRNIQKAGDVMDILYRYYADTLSEAEMIDYAFILSGRRQYDQASNLYHQAVQRFPSSTEAYLGLADLDFMHRRYREAAHNYQKAMDLGTASPQVEGRILQGLGRLASTRKDFRKSLELLHKASQAWPESGEIHFDLVRVYAELKDYRQAWRHVELAESKGTTIGPDFKAKLRLAERINP
jgi:tetratricopeptide (TPR) repeat protein